MVNATPRPLYPRQRDPVPNVQEVGWATEPVWTCAENLVFHWYFFSFVQRFYCSIQSISYICLADGQLGIQKLRSWYCYFTYFIVLARHCAPFFRLTNIYTFFYVCMLLAVADYVRRPCCIPRSSFVTYLVQAKELHKGFDPWTVQLVTSHYTDYAIPVHVVYHFDVFCSNCVMLDVPSRGG
jgi:hypothetical protein